MKIAFLNIYSGTNNRGAESFAHELATRLRNKHDVKFFRGIDFGVPIVQPTNNLRLLKLLFLDGAALSVLYFTLKIFPELWKGHYDWIIPMNGFWQVLLCKFIFKSKILITGHSGPGWDEKWNLWLKPDVFVATTEPSAKWAKRTSPWTTVVAIPYGINIEKFAKAKPVKLNLERPIILCPAAAVEYKRVDLAIKAVAKLGKGSLLYIGTGPLLSHLNDLGEKLLGKRYLNLALPYEKMPAYYEASDVVTLPSKSQENSPMVFLEAMAAGKMTVTTDTSRARWILNSAGIFIDPANIEEYSRALQAGLDSHKETISEAQRFDWNRVISSYLLILEET